MEGWTKDKVRDWLISDVKVSPTDAQRFFEEDVSGEYLVEFTKREILDMGIKHGPAVKITNHLNQWKDHPQTQPQCPAYVLSWTKEQVKLWLLRHVKLYDKYAQKLLEEEVSGDCLVYFEKQDFKDLDIKQGPIVKILAELGRLKDKAEPELLPEASTEEKQLSVQPEPSVSQPVPQNKSSERTTSPTTPFVQNTQRTPPQQPSAPNTKTTAEVRQSGGGVTGIVVKK